MKPRVFYNSIVCAKMSKHFLVKVQNFASAAFTQVHYALIRLKKRPKSRFLIGLPNLFHLLIANYCGTGKMQLAKLPQF